LGRRTKETSEENVRDKILSKAKEIIESEGFEKLSVRKITKQLGYTPGIIYHYFSDKEEIVNILLFEWYDEIISAIKSTPDYPEDPRKEILEKSWAYFSKMLKMPGVYREFLLSQNEEILRYTRILNMDSTNESLPLNVLKTLLEKGIEKNQFDPCDPELTSHIIWTSLFGLIIKVITEGLSDSESQKVYFDHLFNLIFKGLGYV
jgi:AcrR family transcriptional regulator